MIDHNLIESAATGTFPLHPFDSIPADTDVEVMMANYLAMSQAFPYLQSGSQKSVFDHYFHRGMDIPKEVEITTVVGNFLAWDETGGLYVTLRKKMKGIADILETEKFHANLLKSDLASMFNKEVKPDYSDITKSYLAGLYANLASLDHAVRCAAMVSFETHANRMISALWNTISERVDVDKDSLRYFSTHVGGDDPAEQYHVMMTEKMISLITGGDEQQERRFLDLFLEIYAQHVRWCESIKHLA